MNNDSFKLALLELLSVLERFQAEEAKDEQNR